MIFRRLFWLIVAALVLFFFGLLYLKLTLPLEDSSVLLKDHPDAPITGYVTKKDKYIIVSKEGSEQIFPWDDVKNISGPKPPASKSRIFSSIIDNLDFLSGLGILSALVIFSVGLYQYQQGLLWKREEFLSEVIKCFGESPNVSNATQMIEALRQYQLANINLHPEKKDAGQATVSLTKEEIKKSLAARAPDADAQTQKIRRSFDTFLDYFETLNDYIRSTMVARRSVHVHIGYWLDLLGRYDKLDEDSRSQVIDYAKYFDYTGAINLIYRYNKLHRLWWRIKNKGPKVADNAPAPDKPHEEYKHEKQ